MLIRNGVHNRRCNMPLVGKAILVSALFLGFCAPVLAEKEVGCFVSLGPLLDGGCSLQCSTDRSVPRIQFKLNTYQPKYTFDASRFGKEINQRQFFLRPEDNPFTWQPFMEAFDVGRSATADGELALVLCPKTCQFAHHYIPNSHGYLILLNQGKEEPLFRKTINFETGRNKLRPHYEEAAVELKFELSYGFNKISPDGQDWLDELSKGVLKVKDWANLGRWLRDRELDDRIHVCIEGLADETPFSNGYMSCNGMEIDVYNYILSWLRAHLVRQSLEIIKKTFPGCLGGPPIEIKMFWYGNLHPDGSMRQRKVLVSVFANGRTPAELRSRIDKYSEINRIEPSPQIVKEALRRIAGHNPKSKAKDDLFSDFNEKNKKYIEILNSLTERKLF